MHCRARLAVACLLALAGAAPSVGPPHRPADAHGDPLPPGAFARLGTLRFRATGHDPIALLSPDGKLVAVSGRRDVSLRDTASGRVVRRLSGDRERAGGPAAVQSRREAPGLARAPRRPGRP
jgi:hypothetical protein